MEFSFVEELVHRLKVFQAMSKNVVTITPKNTLRDAQITMRDARVSGLPVVKDNIMIGIVTIEDVIQALDHGYIEEPVDRWMTQDVVTVVSNWPLSRAMSILDRTRFGRLPVLDKEGSLCGLITPNSILRALLSELNRLLARDEKSEVTIETLENESLRLQFDVEAGDYDRAGLASVQLKRELAARGVDPGLQRRVAIAAHEAETNLIIHSTSGGTIIAVLEPESIRLTVTDNGPGIENIEQAMQPGYSTASDFVRSLGFGAGMGLGNIKRCTDHFELKSKPGLGTRLNLRFDLRPSTATATTEQTDKNSLLERG
ncbi:MAG: CBS domain-containing protein [Desulfobacterales bacterium]|nr:CBS domain-containing protein [Desulfobacterales bacterium]